VGQVRRSGEGSRRLPGALGGVRFTDGFGGREQSEAWNAVSILLSGICTFGAIGFGLDHLFGTAPILLVVGILLGKGLAAYFIYARHFARYEEVKASAPGHGVAGWSQAAPVAGAGSREHPKADLSAWPYTGRTSRAS